jgi:ribosome-associated toxin RatA of RatAB toxin-antitoxin module
MCVATETYNTTITYIQDMCYTVMRKRFHNPFMIVVIHTFWYFNLAVSPLHCNHQYHADFDICHDLHGLIIGEHVSHLSEEVPSYIVSHRTHTTIRAYLNKKASVCVCEEN